MNDHPPRLPFRLLLIALLAGPLLSGCVAAVVGGTAAGVGHDRRSWTTVISDRNIQATAYDNFNKDKELALKNNVSIVVYNGVMLLVGEVRTDELKQRAERRVSGYAGVRKLVNEIEVREPEGFLSQRRGRPEALMVGGSVMVGATLTNKTPVTLQNTVAVARMTEEAGVIIVPAASPYQNIGQLADALKANPRGVSVAGGSAGGTDHIILGLMLQKLGRQPREASFVAFPGGGPAQAAILGGQVAAGISGWSEFSEQIKAGRVRALATTGERRLDPAVPTLKESGLDVVATNWRGVFGAPGINAAQRQALVDLMTAIHATEAWRRILADRGWEDAFLTGAPFDAFLERDRAETEGVLKDLGLA